LREKFEPAQSAGSQADDDRQENKVCCARIEIQVGRHHARDQATEARDPGYHSRQHCLQQ